MSYMNLIDLVDFLDENGFERKIVSSSSHRNILSFYKESNFSIQINEDVFNETIRLCLGSTNDDIFLYVNNFTLQNYSKFNINSISNITII